MFSLIGLFVILPAGAVALLALVDTFTAEGR